MECIRTTSAPSSTARASRSGPATTARCRSWKRSALPQPPGPLSAATTTPRTSSGWSRACRKCASCSVESAGGAVMDLKELYRDVILDHNRSPRNFGRLEPADAQADGHNPLCGDKLTLTLRMQDDRVQDLRFEGQGCAISTASASLMTEAVKGRSRQEIARLFDEVHALLTAPSGAPAPELGKLLALAGVAEYPARVKCASLCWHTLNAALERAPAAVSTE